MAMAIFLQSNDCHLITIRARLAGCPARLPARLFLAFRLALDARYRHVQDDREQRKNQRRTLDHNLHGEVTCYIVPYDAAQGSAPDRRSARAQNRRTSLAGHTRALSDGRLAFRHSRTASLRPGLAVAGGGDSVAD